MISIYTESYRGGDLQKDKSEVLESAPLDYSVEILTSSSVWGNYRRPREPLNRLEVTVLCTPPIAETSAYPHCPKHFTNRKLHDSWRIWQNTQKNLDSVLNSNPFIIQCWEKLAFHWALLKSHLTNLKSKTQKDQIVSGNTEFQNKAQEYLKECK